MHALSKSVFPGEQIHRGLHLTFSSPFLAFPLLPSLLLPIFLSFPFLPFPSAFLRLSLLRSRTPEFQLDGLGERCELPQQGLGGAQLKSNLVQYSLKISRGRNCNYFP